MNKTRYGIWALALASAASLASCASVKEFEQTATFAGRICDRKGMAVSEYRVECDGQAVLTGSNGIFVFADMKAGSYRLTGGKRGWTSIDEKVTFVDRKKLLCIQVNEIESVYDRVEMLLGKNEATQALSLLELHEKENKASPLFEFYRTLAQYCQDSSAKKLDVLHKLMKKSGVDHSSLAEGPEGK